MTKEKIFLFWCIFLICFACWALAPAFAQGNWRGCPPNKKHLCKAEAPAGMRVVIVGPTVWDWIEGRATLDQFAQLCASKGLPCDGICKQRGTDEDIIHVYNNYGLCYLQALPLIENVEGVTELPTDTLLNME
jgi:hypothetical protein